MLRKPFADLIIANIFYIKNNRIFTLVKVVMDLMFAFGYLLLFIFLPALFFAILWRHEYEKSMICE